MPPRNARPSKKITLPDSKEWDFRAVDESALEKAALYEYARSATKLRERLVAWLDTKLAGKKIRRHILDALIAAQKDGKRGSLAQLYYPRKLDNKIAELGWKTGCDLRLLEIIECSRPDFPSPWLAFPIRYEKNVKFSRIGCTPIENKIRRMRELAARTGQDAMDCFERCHATPRSNFLLSISWNGERGEGVTVEVLLKDFERWLRDEAKAHQRKRGSPSQAQTWKLKALAAWRLRHAGFTFDAAQDALQKFNDGGRLIPTFAESSSWSDAMSRARCEIQKLEAFNPETKSLISVTREMRGVVSKPQP